MIEHDTVVEAEIYEEKEKNEWVLLYRGRTSKMSSGSMWGGCTSASSYDEAVRKLMDETHRNNIWCDSYQGADGKIYRIGDKFHTRVFINEKEVPFTENNTTLTEFM